MKLRAEAAAALDCAKRSGLRLETSASSVESLRPRVRKGPLFSGSAAAGRAPPFLIDESAELTLDLRPGVAQDLYRLVELLEFERLLQHGDGTNL